MKHKTLLETIQDIVESTNRQDITEAKKGSPPYIENYSEADSREKEGLIADREKKLRDKGRERDIKNDPYLVLLRADLEEMKRIRASLPTSRSRTTRPLSNETRRHLQ